MKNLILFMAMCASSVSAVAQSDNIQLIPPSKSGGLSVMETFWNRHTDREFSTESLSDQDLSDLMFAASGVNRPAEGKLTSPTALNTQEIDLYLFSPVGVFKYIPAEHRLQMVANGDYRKLIAGTPEFSQDFVMDAPVSLLTVANPQKFERLSDLARTMAIADAGIMTENVCVFCAGKGLAAVPRATMDYAGIKKLLSLPEQSFPVLNITVGHPK